MLKVTVERSRWLRGEGGARSFLLRSDDRKMCCFGFACIASGLAEGDITNVATPIGVGLRPSKMPEWCQGRIGDGVPKATIVTEMMAANDAEIGRYYAPNDTWNGKSIKSDEQREELLKDLGKKIGIEFEFV